MKDIKEMTMEEYLLQVHDAGEILTDEISEPLWALISKAGKKIMEGDEINPTAMEHAFWIMFLGLMMFPFQEADLETQKRAFGRYAIQLRAVMENEAIRLGIHP